MADIIWRIHSLQPKDKIMTEECKITGVGLYQVMVD